MHKRKTLFISDLHLEDSHSQAAQQFFDLLEASHPSSVDALYILGDLFEAWIGDDDNSFHRDIIQSLKSATGKGLPIYFLRGNRDFLIGRKFMRATGCQLLADKEKISLYGTQLLLMHGDTLCTQDIAYLKWRKYSRNPILNTLLFSIWPLAIRKRMANKMRSESKNHTQKASKEIMDVTPDEVVRIMQKHKVQILIHGHTHRPAIHKFSLNDLSAERIVLGSWHERGNVLIWEENGKKEWVEL